ncbi:MAG: M20/M25/M40 family metallo-hydrolase, partial [Anaerolineae bacterium]
MFTLSPANQTALTDFARQMVKTPSFSGMEGTLGQLVARRMEQVGFDHIAIDDMGNVISRLGSGAGPRLLYYTHLDTVGIGDIAAWQKDPLAGVVENGILHGRGAADPKGGL